MIGKYANVSTPSPKSMAEMYGVEIEPDEEE